MPREPAAAPTSSPNDTPARILLSAPDRLPRLAPPTGATKDSHTKRSRHPGRATVPRPPAVSLPYSLPTLPLVAPTPSLRVDGSEPAGSMGDEPVRQSRKPASLARPLIPAAWRPPLGVWAPWAPGRPEAAALATFSTAPSCSPCMSTSTTSAPPAGTAAAASVIARCDGANAGPGSRATACTIIDCI